jgi:hypothetical protein
MARVVAGGGAVVSDVLTSVQQYLDEGWSPIPIPAGEKGPRLPDWESKTFTVADFDPDSNVGVHLGRNGLYDVDLDDKRAAIAADILLPNTSRLSGRASKPRSHRWFTSADHLVHEHYFGLGGQNDTIVELRGWTKKDTPEQTVVPPSTHASGEGIVWHHAGKPMEVNGDLLRRSVRNVAIATLLARHFPGPGHRHQPRMALAGFLFRAGLDEAEVLAIGKAVMRLIGGDETDWNDTARSTIAKLKAGDDTRTRAPPLTFTRSHHGCSQAIGLRQSQRFVYDMSDSSEKVGSDRTAAPGVDLLLARLGVGLRRGRFAASGESFGQLLCAIDAALDGALTIQRAAHAICAFRDRRFQRGDAGLLQVRQRFVQLRHTHRPSCTRSLIATRARTVLSSGYEVQAFLVSNVIGRPHHRVDLSGTPDPSCATTS